MSPACGTVAGVSTPLQELLVRHVESGTIPGAVALLGPADAETVAAGSAELGGAPMRVDAIMRIQSMTKIVTSVAALRLVEAGRLDLEQSVVPWLPELDNRRVLRSPDADLDDTEPARGPVTLRHLLTNTSGYGMILQAAPLQQAMLDNGTESGPEPPALGADEWLHRLAELPLAFQPGTGWRYHHSFGLLGILISRVVGQPLGEHLTADVFEPLGMPDTAFWVPPDKLDRLPAAYRRGESGFEETEPATGGFYASPPPFDVSHAELVSTVADFHRFLVALVAGELISPAHLAALRSDQVPASVKSEDSFFPGFWNGAGWGFGVSVRTDGPDRGRFGWAGGQGTDFFVDPDGTVGLLYTQVEMGAHIWPLLEAFQALRLPG